MLTFTVVWLLSVSRENLAEAEGLLRSFNLEARWFTQPANPRTFQARVETAIELPINNLASELARCSRAFEIETQESLILFHVGLGLKGLQRDASGELTIRFGQLDEINRLASGNRDEYERLIRLARGQAWFDLLEPLRRGMASLDGLRKVS